MGEAERFLNELFDTKLSNLHTMTIARVVGISGNRVSVQRIGKKRGADGILRDHPIQSNLPTTSLRLTIGESTDTYTPVYQIGDVVVVVFSERAIDRVLESSGTVDPGSYRRHSINDGVVIGLIAGV